MTVLLTALTIALSSLAPSLGADTSTSAPVQCGAEDTTVFWDAFQCGNHRGSTPVFSLPAA